MLLETLSALVLPPLLLVGWACVQAAARRARARAADGTADRRFEPGPCGQCTCSMLGGRSGDDDRNNRR